METPKETDPSNDVLRRVQEIIDQPDQPPTDIEIRAKEIIAEAAASGAPESTMDRLCEGGAETQAEAESAKRIEDWLQREKNE
jgi:hypothetical protein